ncbi:MAG: RDD family protein [Acidimicrobiales bacterium]|nr:RDD family protein [Acidimicrobiales bacterium]
MTSEKNSTRPPSPANPQPAGLVRRALAWTIDTAFLIFLISVVLLFTATQHPWPENQAGHEACAQLTEQANACYALEDQLWLFDVSPTSPAFWIPLAAFLAIHIGLTSLTGRSIGKAATGLRVVTDPSGETPDITATAGRTLPWIAAIAIPQIGLGIILAEIGLVLTSRRRLGDRIGATQVVRKSS